MDIKQIETEQAYEEIIAQEKPIIVIFKTTWCKDCHYIEPFMPELIQKYEDEVSFVQVDRDDLPDVCEKLNILGIPSFIAFKKSEELIRFVSKLQKSKDEIEQFIERVIAVSRSIA